MDPKATCQKAKAAKCNLCGKYLSCKRTLSTHMKIVHQEIRNQACSECDYKASNAQRLKNHAVHLGIKGHKCVECAIRTNNRSNLLKHIKTINKNIQEHACLKVRNPKGNSKDSTASNLGPHQRSTCQNKISYMLKV